MIKTGALSQPHSKHIPNQLIHWKSPWETDSPVIKFEVLLSCTQEPTVNHILGQANPVHTLMPCFFTTYVSTTTSPTGGGHLVGIVRSQTKATESSLV
jgi:hypothetical protein